MPGIEEMEERTGTQAETREGVPTPLELTEEAITEDLIPGYRILGLVGRGSQGVVYRAVQKCLDRVVALKIVSLRSATRDSMQLRLEREARAIGKLNHPNIVAAYDFGEFRGRKYLAMEFVEGTSCDREIASRNAPLSMAKSLGIVREAALGLQAALDAGIVHRDIKPGNILLSAEDGSDPAAAARVHVKVTDLGLSRMGVSDLTVEGTVLGTPGYMAPEQARGEEVDHRADIYALGATLYHLVTGHRPFGAPAPFAMLMRQANERLPDPREHEPTLPQGLSYLLQGMMSRGRATRYPGYRELIEDVDRVAAGARPLHPLPPIGDRSLHRVRKVVPTEKPVAVNIGSRILVLDSDAPGVERLLDGSTAERRIA